MFFKIFFDNLINVIILDKGNIVKTYCNEKLNINNILKLFKKGAKPCEDHKIGIEYERIPINSENFSAVGYSGEFGILEFLRNFAKTENWDYITDDYNIIGLKKLHNTITLEPGCQLEMSIEPQKLISDIESKIAEMNKKMMPLLNKFGITLLEYGVSPASTYKNIGIIPKRRYHLMANYLWGILSDVMMRETAGIQVCLDFESEEDAMWKFRLANMLSPFATAMFANSPIRGGVETGYKSFRALSWLNTDNERCGFCGKFQRDFGFRDYINYVLNTPMLFINREDKVVEINGRINFEEFMTNGFEGWEADIEDFCLHANLYFPDVRLRKFIEIRNHDCVGRRMEFAIPAFYKGLLYNPDAAQEVDAILSKFSFNDFAEFRYNVPKYALDTYINEYSVKDIAKELLNISYRSLLSAGEGEERYLEPIAELTNYGLTPADVIIANWNGNWNKDIYKLIKYLKNN